MYWTVKVLKRLTPESMPEWVPVDPENPTYDNYRDAVHAHDDYRQGHPDARLDFSRVALADG